MGETIAPADINELQEALQKLRVLQSNHSSLHQEIEEIARRIELVLEHAIKPDLQVPMQLSIDAVELQTLSPAARQFHAQLTHQTGSAHKKGLTIDPDIVPLQRLERVCQSAFMYPDSQTRQPLSILYHLAANHEAPTHIEKLVELTGYKSVYGVLCSIRNLTLRTGRWNVHQSESSYQLIEEQCPWEGATHPDIAPAMRAWWKNIGYADSENPLEITSPSLQLVLSGLREAFTGANTETSFEYESIPHINALGKRNLRDVLQIYNNLFDQPLEYGTYSDWKIRLKRPLD